MPETALLNPNLVIQGSYGELHKRTAVGPPEVYTFMANISHVAGKFTTNKLEIRRSGTRRMAYKRGMLTGDGTITGFKVTSEFLSTFVDEFNDEDPPSDIILKVTLDDPESLGIEELKLTGVKLWEIDFGWQVGDMVEENIPFTFENASVLTPLTGTITQ